MAVKKSGATTKKKKTTVKTGGGPRSAKKPSAAPARPHDRSKNPLYLLIILMLLTAIALLLNRFYLGNVMEEKKGVIPTERNLRKDLVGDEGPVTTPPEEKTTRPAAQEKNPPPVRPAMEEVTLFFVRHDERDDKIRLVPVSRKVERDRRIENTIQVLAQGPTAAERRRGLLTAIPQNLRVRNVRVRDRVAEVDFNGAIEEGATGSILINRVDQIVYTLTEFKEVDRVLIKVNGVQRQTLGADGLSISGPRDRSR